MCGIWAIFGFPKQPEYVSHALKISSRGPDCFNMQTVPEFPNCFLAFHWLKVVDDPFGMQPMRIKKIPHLYMICDGRIFNHKELGSKYNFEFSTNSGLEVIIHLYNKFGIKKTAQLLDGTFALCIIDTRKKEIHLVRDLFGSAPMYTLAEPQKAVRLLGICSEVKGLAPLYSDIKNDYPDVKINHFLPGNYASYRLSDDGNTFLLVYESFTYVGKPPEFDTRLQPSPHDILPNIRNLLYDAVRKSMIIGDKRIGCYLSGGLDSSLLSAIACEVAKEIGLVYPIQTFSIGMEGSPDLEAAQKVAVHIGSEHHELVLALEEGIEVLPKTIYALESYDPLLIRSAVFQYLLTKYISSKSDTIVLISGEGADSLFQGFSYYHRAPSAEEADKESRRSLAEMYTCGSVRADRCNSAFGLEHRAPFQGTYFTSYVLSLPPHMRQPKDRYEKWLLREAFDKTDLLPQDILWRSKLMFSEGASPSTPGQSWYDILQTKLESEISDECMKQARARFPFNTPETKEGLYYRQIFGEFFPDCEHLVPSIWAPKW